MYEYEMNESAIPAELLIGQGPFVPVGGWEDVWRRVKEATHELPWGVYVAWVVLNAGGEVLVGVADSRDSFASRYGESAGQMFMLYGDRDS
jgi:hypothetical protein